MPSSAVECDAPPARVWSLVAEPARWHEWSPYVRAGEGLGSPEVRAGAEGRVVLLGGARVPATIVEVVPGESWSWRVGGVLVDHRVTPLPDGRARLEQTVEGSPPLWSLAALLYAPLVGLIGRNVARVAARG